MKNNKKGFTLIELLAVVVIMLAISVMAVSSISAAIKRNNKKQDETKIKVLESYGELYYEKHKNETSRFDLCSVVEEFSLSKEEYTYSNDDSIVGCFTASGGKLTFEVGTSCGGGCYH